VICAFFVLFDSLFLEPSIALGATLTSTSIVQLHRTTPVHASPGGKVVKAVSARTPLTHSQTVLPIISIRDGWYRVRLPDRPDGSTGWISTIGTTLSTTPWLVRVDRARRSARIYRSGRLQRTYSVVVGRSSLPTPTGTFFVTEVFEDRGSVSGPYALATSAYSNFLQEFDGGPGQIALHGREGLPEPLGTASSHGCVRFDNAAIAWLAWHVPVGTPIIIA
jgi:lipoprotein-anchoring transpeptidase ErfK/SrfK